MNINLNRREEGFTIIEVVLVLAIAALIMLMVFLALPALQRGQRDTQRKNDVSRLQSAINNYKSSNRGAIPQAGDWNTFVTNYMQRDGDQFADPLGTEVYDIEVTADTELSFSAAAGTVDAAYATPEAASKMYIHYGGSCDFEAQQITDGSSSARNIVILKALEGGGYECREA